MTGFPELFCLSKFISDDKIKSDRANKRGVPGGDLPWAPNLLRAPNLKISLKLKKAPSKSRRVLGIKGPV